MNEELNLDALGYYYYKKNFLTEFYTKKTKWPEFLNSKFIPYPLIGYSLMKIMQHSRL